MAQNKNKAISATNLKHHNQGVGTYLLPHALVTIRQAAALVGIGVIVVEAKNTGVTEFYKKFGFVWLQSDPPRLYLLVSTLQGARPV